MTQEQYGQTRGPGYVVRGDAVPEDENEEFPTGESKPMTRFQKVASALRGGGSEQDEQDETAADQVANAQVAADPAARDQAAQATDPEAPSAGPPWVTQQDEAAMANSPISREANRPGDYWDEPTASATDRNEEVTVTSPDVPVPEMGTDPLPREDQVPGRVGTDAGDHPATQPDMFGTTTHAGNGATSAPYPEGSGDQAGEATTADVPAGEATGTAGRHAAADSAGTESRPGEAAGTVSDFSDLADGNLLADAAVYIEQWQQVQFKFVDDPHASVTEAADIIAQVTARLEAAIQERQRAIEERQRAIAEQQRSLRDRWGEGSNADTEGLRETLRMYRTFLDQLIGPRAG
jgi:hypothetical protein